MLAWLFWFIYALIPAIITIAMDLPMQTMTVMYFVFILVAIIFMGIREKTRKKALDEV